MNKLKAIWKIEELRGKILVTLLLLLAFRLGCCLPVPFVSNTALDAMFSNNSIFGYMNMLSGGALSRSAFFARREPVYQRIHHHAAVVCGASQLGSLAEGNDRQG